MSLALVVLAPLAISAAIPPTAEIHRSPDLATPTEASKGNCRSRIEQARQDLGQPKLDRHGASPGEPVLFYAVDRLIDGCEVLVMHNNLADIRPLPEFHGGPGRLLPAH